MASLTLKTREQPDRRIFVSDGQGTAETYPVSPHKDAEDRHKAAAEHFLRELKGWHGTIALEVLDSAPGEYLLTAERRDGRPSRKGVRVSRLPSGQYELRVGSIRPIDLSPEDADELLNVLGGLRHQDHQEAGKEAFYASRPDLDPTTGLPHDWPKED